MSIAGFSVKRPIFVLMASGIVMILGAIALRHLPVDLMPEITYPALTVTTAYEDASPEEVEELISKRIESAVSAVPGVNEVRSSSTEGSSSVTVSFNWGINLDDAVADVRDRLDRVNKSLPDGADRPAIRKFDSAAMPIMRIGVATDIDLLTARFILEDQIQYRLERIDGVASADVSGGRQREIQVLFDPDKARMLNVPLQTVIEKIGMSNVTTPAGNVREGRLEVRIRTPGTYTSLDQVRDTVIGQGGDGEDIRIRDVAEVIDTHKKITRYVRVNGRPGIMMQIYKQSGANTVEIADRVTAELKKINLEYKNQIELQPMMNSADYIKQALSGVSDSAASGGLLAIFVLLIFLRNLGSTLAIAISIPMSIIATFAAIYFGGFTLNIMTIGGLALGIGMLVDNSIVVLENITRLHDDGMPAKQAAICGTNEVAAAITASTLTTLAVFLPLLFMQEMAGIMFRQLSAVVAFSLGCSLVVAVTIVPVLASRLFKRSDAKRKNRLIAAVAASLSRLQRSMEDQYASVLDTVLRRRWLFAGITVVLVALSVLPARYLGSELMPKADENEVVVNLETAVGTSPDVVNEVVRNTEKTITDVVGGDMTGFLVFAGSSGWRSDGGHKARYSIKLTSRSKRLRSDAEIADALAKKLAGIPGATFRTRTGTGMFSRMLGAGGESVNIDIRGYDIATAAGLAGQIMALAATVPGVTDVKLSRDLGTPEDRIAIDRRKADSLNVSVKSIADALRTILAGSEAGQYREAGDEYSILVKVKDADRLTIDQILDLSIPSQSGERVVLRNLVGYQRVSGPVAIERKNQERILSIGVNIFNRDMGSVVRDIQAKLASVPMPPGFNINFVGDYEDQQKAFHELLIAFVLALALVYMVMACQFESLLNPLVVMLSVPLAGIGVVTMLLLTDTTINMQSFIGCIMLAGIVVNNAILLVDTANMLRSGEKGMNLDAAIREAGRRRLRPIMMTTLTTVLGLLPLALGLGDGGEMQAPMARAVIGGLTSSTLVTLFFIPAIYRILESFLSGGVDRTK